MPLRFVAMGLVVVFVEARLSGVDALPDPVGWALVVAALVQVRTRLPQGGLLVGLAVAALLVSVPLAVPALDAALDATGQWAVSVPQVVFCVVLCRALAPAVAGAGGPDAAGAGTRLASRLRLLGWVFVVLLVAPVVVYGGGVEALATPVAVAAVLANVALVWLTFRASGSPLLGEPRSETP